MADKLRLRLPALLQAPGLARDAALWMRSAALRLTYSALWSLHIAAWRGASACLVHRLVPSGTVQVPGWLALVRRLIQTCPGLRRQVSVCGLVWLVLCFGTWLLSPAQSAGASQLRLEALSALPEAMLATRFAGSQRHFTQLFSSSAAAAAALA